MSATVGTVLDAARTMLADNGGLDWQDTEVMQKFQTAHRELQLKLFRAGIPLEQATSPVMSVPAGTKDLTTISNYPTDVVLPIWLFERLPGQDDNSFLDMIPRDFVPITNQVQRLYYWTWQQQKVLFVGSTSDTEVKMRYRTFLTVPTLNSQDIGILLGETFLTFRVAALCLEQLPNQGALAQVRNIEALNHIEDIVAANINLQKQMLPSRRVPYHRRGNRYSTFFPLP